MFMACWWLPQVLHSHVAHYYPITTPLPLQPWTTLQLALSFQTRPAAPPPLPADYPATITELFSQACEPVLCFNINNYVWQLCPGLALSPNYTSTRHPPILHNPCLHLPPQTLDSTTHLSSSSFRSFWLRKHTLTVLDLIRLYKSHFCSTTDWTCWDWLSIYC